MAYSYLVMNYPGAEDDLRGIFGVDNDTLSSETIHRLPNMPAAERELSSLVSEPLGDYENANLMSVRLACLYLTAANCLAAVKTNLLIKESDTKTTGQRFKDALTYTEKDLRKKAEIQIGNITAVTDSDSDSPIQLSLFSPSVDVITGS